MGVVNTHEAKTNLSKLIDEVQNGAEIVIARANRPVARLVPIREKPSTRRPGYLKGKVRIAADFDAPHPRSPQGSIRSDSSRAGDHRTALFPDGGPRLVGIFGPGAHRLNRIPETKTGVPLKRNRKVETIAAQAGVGADKAYGAVSVPIYTAAIYRYERFGKNKGFDYSRGENPTRQAAEKTLADLEGGSRAVAFSSGMAAISALMTLFRTGDHILCSDDLYGGTYRLFEKLLRPYGLSFDYVDMGNPAAVRKRITGKTKALFIETPTNPLMKIADLKGAAKIGREKGVLTVVDNTFMSPLLQRPLAFGIDVVVHSATKFLGGHNDLIGGAVVTTDAAVGEKIAFAQKAIGAIPSPFDCWLLLRGIKTLAVRVTRAQENADALARFLSGHPAVGKIYYPGLPGHPRRELHFSQATGAGSIISFDLKREKAVPAFLSALKTILLAESLGGVESLITHPSTMTHADIPLEEQAAVGLTPSLVRLSVGIEDRGELQADLSQALRKATGLTAG